ncbi:MAG: hypothetical protein EGS41_09500 [Prevotella sp.]|jgi:hypothetical protein|nr:hypothetical protein [Prevotella sp.]
MITFVTNLKLNFKFVTVMDKELIKRTLDDVISRMFRFLPVITLTILSNPTIKTKTPKLYFYDVGLAAWLMGIIVTSYGVKKYI